MKLHDINEPCDYCGGYGFIEVDDATFECCNQVLPSGECCAAIYGEANLVPTQITVREPCPDCQPLE